jgi:DNA segregation ATPase FtsK/SpoIIIE, S-DNA-T family
MANRQKSKKSQASANTLKADKEERVSVRQIAKDERTHKITGAVLLLLAIFLFVAFTSYSRGVMMMELRDKVFPRSCIIPVIKPTIY